MMTNSSLAESFEVVLEPEEEGGYHVFAPSLKGCHSYGCTREEALKNISEAIALWLEAARELSIPIPERDSVKVQIE